MVHSDMPCNLLESLWQYFIKDSYFLFSCSMGPSDWLRTKWHFILSILTHAGKYMYTHTEQKTVNGERVEQIMQLSKRQYQVGVVDTLSRLWSLSPSSSLVADVGLSLAQSFLLISQLMLSHQGMQWPPLTHLERWLSTPLHSSFLQMLYKQRDPQHHTIHKTRRCFVWKEHYFQLDILKEPCTERWRREEDSFCHLQYQKAKTIFILQARLLEGWVGNKNRLPSTAYDPIQQ